MSLPTKEENCYGQVRDWILKDNYENYKEKYKANIIIAGFNLQSKLWS